ncbi:BON domain-containing protein [Pseudokordiimonas caeni]|uniref:BON domain-containing protein n=1 Tax=Pseudokordiimonas caeni TaxID=2997908 RepID=UPI0028115B55|nr:BON domain-containing protein [Pseudokordiimonas caeni]
MTGSTTNYFHFKHALLRYSALAALVAGLSGASTAAEITDIGIVDAVKDELTYDPAVYSTSVDVSSVDGIVTLSGRVGDILAKERAVRLAGTIRGVRAIVNQIEVDPVLDVPPANIERNIELALQEDAATDDLKIKAKANQAGFVTLNGTVDSWAQVNLVETVAKGVYGVTGVDNRIDFNYTDDRSDEDIKADVKARMDWNPLIDAKMVEVDVDDGVVSLDGKVGSVAERSKAVGLAYVAGVSKVNLDDLEVDEWDDDMRRREGSDIVRSNEEVTNAVNDALFYDPRVSYFKIDVEADRGEVTLRGSVDNLAAKRAAGQDARNTTGVIRVKNRLDVVSPMTGKPENVIAKVESALERNPYTYDDDITAAMFGGVVRLYGDVDSLYERAEADRVASRVVGVEKVVNLIDVRDDNLPLAYDPYLYDFWPNYAWYDRSPITTMKTDAEIADDIEDQLFWSIAVDSDEVNVSVDNGEATLTGTVDSESERYAAIKNAYDGGAVDVIDDLEVERVDGSGR